MKTRYFAETECEHGELKDHPIGGPEDLYRASDGEWVRPRCPGGSRRELDLANGQRVEWCRNHQGIAWEDFDEDNARFYAFRGHRCPSGEWIEGAAAWDCYVVSKLLIDPTTEEEA